MSYIFIESKGARRVGYKINYYQQIYTGKILKNKESGNAH